MMTRMSTLAWALCAASFVACGSSDSNPSAASPATPTDASTSADGATAEAASDAVSEEPQFDPDANCVKPGTASNEKGFGGFCTKTEDCTGSGLHVCSGEFGAPIDHWFCTGPCSTDDDCGTGAACASNDLGRGCVPLVCLGSDGGGAESGSDAASSDAASEAASDATSGG